MYMYTKQSLEKLAKSGKTRKPSGNVSDLECFGKRTTCVCLPETIKQFWMPIEPDFVKYFTQHYQNRAGKNVSCTNPKFDYLIITYREMGKVLPPF